MGERQCEICERFFKQKSHYDAHINRKTPCKKDERLEKMVETKVNEILGLKSPVFNLLEGDVVEKLKELPDKKFDCIVTSPPYNIGKDYGKKVDDKKPMDKYLDWLLEVFQECKRVLKDEGSLFINIGYSNVEPWISMDVAQKLRNDFTLQNNITWVKNISIDDISYGHFKPINSHRFLNVTNETILHFTKKGDIKLERLAIGVPYMHKSNLKERSKKVEKTGIEKPDVRCRGNTWFIKYETIQHKSEKGDHPASFPVELAEKCIKLAVGDKKDVHVLDPFIGSGTTLVACKRLGIEGTGIDINPEFLQFARSRIEKYTP
jgi:site-specific DNA-methyltransferase (adenine-specific)